MKPYRVAGDLLECWPYVRGHYRRDILYTVWKAIEDAQDWPKIFWDSTQTDDPIPTHGDLVEWVDFVHSKVDPKVLLLLKVKDGEELAGIIWFGNIRHGEAAGCIWMAPKFRGGRYSREAVHLGLEHAFYGMKWRKVWALTPWPIARNLIKRCGFKDMVTLPGMHYVGDKPGDVYVLALEEKDYG